MQLRPCKSVFGKRGKHHGTAVHILLHSGALLIVGAKRQLCAGAFSAKRQLCAGAFSAKRQLCAGANYASGAGALYARGQVCLFACRNWLVVSDVNTAMRTG